jgi:hypothetical protein
MVRKFTILSDSPYVSLMTDAKDRYYNITQKVHYKYCTVLFKLKYRIMNYIAFLPFVFSSVFTYCQ